MEEKGAVGLYLNTFREPDPQKGLKRGRIQLSGKRRPPPEGGGGELWRKLTVEVAPEKLVATFDGEEICIMPRSLQDAARRSPGGASSIPLHPRPPFPRFHPGVAWG